MDALLKENRALKRELSTLRGPRYKIDQISPALAGADWAGKWRLRQGFRVIGHYESEEAAMQAVVVHGALAQVKVQRRERIM